MTKTTTPDWITDLFVAFEEHPPMCVCQSCDPEFHMDMALSDLEPPF